MSKIHLLLIFSILSGCGFRSAIKLAFGDWSPDAALAQADRDYLNGRATIYHGPVGPCGPGMTGALGITDNERELVTDLPIDKLPCSSCGYYGSKSQRDLCREQVRYGAVYNKRIVAIIKGSDDNFRYGSSDQADR